MNEKPFRDSLALERHQSFKRWERVVQRNSWKRRGEEREPPLLPCFCRVESDSVPSLRPATLLALFEGGFSLVRYRDSVEPAAPRLLREGIQWEIWHPWLLQAYQRGSRVPGPLVPLRRIPPLWIEKALDWSADRQSTFFKKLRETGILPRLPKLDASTISSWMRWEDVKAAFIDFKEPGSGSALQG